MPINYQRKYIEVVKLYHQLHAEITRLDMQLTCNLKQPEAKNYLNESSNRIKEIDLKFREVIKANWKGTVING